MREVTRRELAITRERLAVVPGRFEDLHGVFTGISVPVERPG